MIEIRFEGERHRSAAYDGGKEIGECTYAVGDGVWVADHTFVNPDYRGQRIANRLFEALADAARAAGVKIRPVCSFVVKEMEQEERYHDLRAE